MFKLFVMNKKEKHDVSSREKKVKRVKTHHSRPNILSLAPVNIDCFHLEEQETIEDSNLKFKEACDEIREHFYTILQAKQGKNTDVNLAEHRADICMLIMRLKKLNRIDKHQWKKSRDAVTECKQKVDALNLQYQNLLYEVTHLQKEVTKCLEFRSKDEEIELVSIEEFYHEAPENISRPDITKADPHELTMARLLWELEQRKRYAQKLKEAEVTKEEYSHKIKNLRERLSNILPTLHSIIESAEPLQSKLGMPFQTMHLRHKVAKFLPKPLYILYVQACAYKEACDKKIQISVEGNIDEAKVLRLKTEEFSDESGDSDQEENTEMNMHRHSVSSRKEETKKDILRKHPMSVYITVESKEYFLTLEFTYLFHLHIVTVCVKSISPQQLSREIIGNLLQLNAFLNYLFPGDCGRDTPNLANEHILRKYGYEESPFSNEKTGWPYIWVQQICGLDFLSSSNAEPCSSKNDSKGTSVYMESVIKAIRTRLVARIQLTHQIASLEKRKNQQNAENQRNTKKRSENNPKPQNVAKSVSQMLALHLKHYRSPIGKVAATVKSGFLPRESAEQKTNIPADFASLYPINILSQLKKWSPLEWKDISTYPNIKELTELSIVNKDAMIFKAEIQRGSALLSTIVIISPEYPVKRPIFVLQLYWKGCHTAVSSVALRELEEEVNVHFIECLPEKYHPNLLICQMFHLTVCFDVFLETEYSGDSFEGPHEFVREKVVARSARGRSHSRPYKCFSHQKIFTFR